MNATAIRDAARFTALIAILVVAAVLGLAVGNAINGRSSAGAGSADLTDSAADYVDYGVRHAPEPDYVDYGVRHAPTHDTGASLTRPTPR